MREAGDRGPPSRHVGADASVRPTAAAGARADIRAYPYYRNHVPNDRHSEPVKESPGAAAPVAPDVGMPLARHRGLARLDRPADLVADRLLGHFQIKGALQVEPELGCRAQSARQPKRRVGGDGPPSTQDLRDAVRRNPERLAELIGVHPQLGKHILRQDFAGVNGSALPVYGHTSQTVTLILRPPLFPDAVAAICATNILLVLTAWAYVRYIIARLCRASDRRAGLEGIAGGDVRLS